ncbi:MAG: methyl-accepting chemotaxis protein [Verrucomicrobiota bacterium]
MKLTIGKRISLGFGAVILLILINGAGLITLLNYATGASAIFSKECEQSLEISESILLNWEEARLNIEKYIVSGQQKFKSQGQQYLEKVEQNLPEAKQITTGFILLNDIEKDVDVMTEQLRTFKNQLNTAEGLLNNKISLDNEFENAAGEFSKSIENYLNYQTSLKDTLAEYDAYNTILKMSYASSMERKAKEIYADALKSSSLQSSETSQFFGSIDADLERLTNISDSSQGLNLLDKAKTALSIYEQSLGNLDSFSDELSATKTELIQTAKVFSEAALAMESNSIKLTLDSVEKENELLLLGRTISITSIILGVILVIAASIIITRSVTKPIANSIGVLLESADTTLHASSELTASGNMLARGASSQAASLEETSASLEEIASVTKQNVDTTVRTKQLTGEAREYAENGMNDMQELNSGVATVQESTNEMNTTMDSIKEASDAISKVIKTIDEIAFQTNILALNAAVEAARAGEAGAGFAVVADEVRSLAQRSADAAKETANMIQTSIERSSQGVEACSKVSSNLQAIITQSSDVSQKLEQIATKVLDVDSATSEITAASQEQQTGIEQLNSVMHEMETVTQNNAASAEETASSAHTLEEQAKSVSRSIADLRELLGPQRNFKKSAIKKNNFDSTETQSHHLELPSSAPVNGDHAIARRGDGDLSSNYSKELKLPGDPDSFA